MSVQGVFYVKAFELAGSYLGRVSVEQAYTTRLVG